MLSPSASAAEPQKRSQLPCGPPKARTRMSRAVAARNVTAARSPVTVSPSTNIRRPVHGLLHLEVDLVPPGLVVVGQGRLGDGHDRRRQDDQSRDGENPAPVGFPAPDLQRLGHVVVTLAVPAVLPPALAEPAHPPVAALLVLAGLPSSCAASQTASGAFSPSGSGGRGRSSPAAPARAAPLSPAGTPARRRAAPPAGTSAGRRPPGAAADRLSSPPPSPPRTSPKTTARAMRTSDGPTGA